MARRLLPNPVSYYQSPFASTKSSNSVHELIDSGAELNRIDLELAKQLDLPLIPLDPAIPATALNSQVFAQIHTKPSPFVYSPPEIIGNPFHFSDSLHPTPL